MDNRSSIHYRVRLSPSIPPPRMPLALRAPTAGFSPSLSSSLRLILPLEGFSSDVANDFPAAFYFLDGRHYLNSPNLVTLLIRPYAASFSALDRGRFLCPIGTDFIAFRKVLAALRLHDRPIDAIRTSPLSRSIA